MICAIAILHPFFFFFVLCPDMMMTELSMLLASVGLFFLSESLNITYPNLRDRGHVLGILDLKSVSYGQSVDPGVVCAYKKKKYNS